MTELSMEQLLQAMRYGEDQPVGVVTPALKTYSATWTNTGGEAEFWQLIGAFTQGLITSGSTVTAFKCERTPEQTAFAFTLRAGPSHIERLVQAATDSIEQSGISTGEAEPFNVGPHFRPSRFRHQAGKFLGEKSAIVILDGIMKALIESQCRLVRAEGGALEGGAYMDFTIAGTRTQVDKAQIALAHSLD